MRTFFAILCVSAFWPTLDAASRAATFTFGDGANGISGQISASLTADDFQLHLAVLNPTGATLNEPDATGMGVRSGALPDVLDPSGSGKSNLLGGTSPLAGTGESIQFWFDRPGRLTEMDFDGVKDEPYEYFQLETATCIDLYFFDSFIGSTADPGLISVPGTVAFLQEEIGNDVIDDRSPPLDIPFSAGQVFMLVYGELPVGDAGNGARLQGITVQAVPEPASAVLLVLGGLWPTASRLRRRAQRHRRRLFPPTAKD